MDTDNSGIAGPPRMPNMRSLEGFDLTSEQTPQTDMSIPARSVTARILVLEEHPLLRDGITDFLNAQPAVR